MRNLFKPKTGSRQIRQIRPWQIGPLADFAANWALHFLGPNLPFFLYIWPWQIGLWTLISEK